MGLQGSDVGDVAAGTGADPVAGERSERHTKAGHAGEHEVDEASQEIRTKEPDRSADLTHGSRHHEGPECDADPDGPEQDSELRHADMEVGLGEHDEQGRGCTSRQGAEHVDGAQGGDEPALPDPPKLCAEAFEPTR